MFMNELEVIIGDICDLHPEWFVEARNLGVDKEMWRMAEFLQDKLEGRR